jgi:hypothetical protein
MRILFQWSSATVGACALLVAVHAAADPATPASAFPLYRVDRAFERIEIAWAHVRGKDTAALQHLKHAEERIQEAARLVADASSTPTAHFSLVPVASAQGSFGSPSLWITLQFLLEDYGASLARALALLENLTAEGDSAAAAVEVAAAVEAVSARFVLEFSMFNAGTTHANVQSFMKSMAGATAGAQQRSQMIVASIGVPSPTSPGARAPAGTLVRRSVEQTHLPDSSVSALPNDRSAAAGEDSLGGLGGLYQFLGIAAESRAQAQTSVEVAAPPEDTQREGENRIQPEQVISTKNTDGAGQEEQITVERKRSRGGLPSASTNADADSAPAAGGGSEEGSNATAGVPPSGGGGIPIVMPVSVGMPTITNILPTPVPTSTPVPVPTLPAGVTIPLPPGYDLGQLGISR